MKRFLHLTAAVVVGLLSFAAAFVVIGLIIRVVSEFVAFGWRLI